MLDETSRRTSLADRVGAQLDEMTAPLPDLGGPEFAALAERKRRAGQPDEARRIAEAGLAGRPDHIEGRIALGLALMDLGEISTAREVLSAALPTPSLARDPDDIGEPGPGERWLEASASRELGGAFPQRAPVGDPDDLEIDRAFEEAESDPSEMMDANRVAEHVLDREMSDLAFDQEARHEAFEGDGGVAVADAAYLDDLAAGEPMNEANRVRILATLETWLQNIRRAAA